MIDGTPAGDVRSASPSAVAPEQRYEFELRTLLLAIGVVLVCIVFVAAGVTWPHVAGPLLRLLIPTLAVVIVVSRAWHALAHVKGRQKSYSPFDGIAANRPRPKAPQALRTLAAIFSAANEPATAQSTAIPWATQQTLIAEVSRRLAEHHSLNINDTSHHAHIRALVSEPTLLLTATEMNPAAGEPVAAAPRVTLNHLDRILEDVEKL